MAAGGTEMHHVLFQRGGPSGIQMRAGAVLLQIQDIGITAFPEVDHQLIPVRTEIYSSHVVWEIERRIFSCNASIKHVVAADLDGKRGQ
jgi:hypothetical protein